MTSCLQTQVKAISALQRRIHPQQNWMDADSARILRPHTEGARWSDRTGLVKREVGARSSAQEPARPTLPPQR